MQIQTISGYRAESHFEGSKISQNQSCIEKIKEWFKRVWETIVRSCSCSQKKQITSQVQPITPIIQPTAPPLLQPPQPIIPNHERIEGPHPERDVPLDELAAPLQPLPAPIPPPFPPLLTMTPAERWALVRQLQERPNSPHIQATFDRLIQNHRDLALKAVYGIFLHIHNLHAMRYVIEHGLIELRPEDAFLGDRFRERFGITYEQYRTLIAAGRVIVDNPDPSREQRQTFLRLYAETKIHILCSARSDGIHAEERNHLNVAQSCLDMALALESGDDAAAVRAAEALALEADRFLNQGE